MVKKKDILRGVIYGILGLGSIIGGIMYARIERDGLTGAIPGNIRSQVINETETPEPEKPTLSREKILTRISQLEQEILQTTNDPDRAIELRLELQNMRAQLELTENR